MNKKQANIKEFGKSFRGKKFSKAEKDAIISRVTELLKDKVSLDVALTILKAEGFKRVDGSSLTEAWVNQWFNRVKKMNKNTKTRHLSGPVKTVYTAKPKAKVSSPGGLLEEVMASNLAFESKLVLIDLLRGKRA